VEFPELEANGLVYEQICRRNGVSTEGEWATISEPVVARVPRRNIIQCCSASVLQSERGKRIEVGEGR